MREKQAREGGLQEGDYRRLQTREEGNEEQTTCEGVDNTNYKMLICYKKGATEYLILYNYSTK